jgi:hypothetical protein
LFTTAGNTVAVYGQCFGSGSDPDSIRPLDPDHHRESESGYRQAKICHKKIKIKTKKLHVIKCSMLSLEHKSLEASYFKEVLHGTTDDSRTEMFRRLALQERARTRERAGGHGLAVQFARTDPGKKSFSVRAVEWNKLPEEVRAARNRAAFIDMMKNL